MTDNKRFKLIDNHLIKYDGDYFDLHKPSDIRTLIKVLNYVTNENEQLKQTIDDLTSEFEGYHKSLEKTKDYTKQFEVTSCPYEIRNNKSNDYYWLEHQGNVIGICKVLNEQSEKINKLEKQIADDFNQSNCITVQKSIIDDLKKENEQLKSMNFALELALKKCEYGEV